MDLSYLATTLKNLRACWPQSWPGLEVVVRSALQHMGHDQTARLTARSQALHDCIFSVVTAIEEDGQRRCAQQREPAYHNRLHFADTVVSMCVLMHNHRRLTGRASQEPLSHAEWLGMLTMVGHDFLHTGQINRFHSEIEALTVQALAPHLSKNKVHKDDQALIGSLILKTDPVYVAESHRLIAGLPFELENPQCLLVLIQECDIMASTLPATGSGLTQQLAQEWESVAPDRSKSLLPPEGRLFFLKKMALFSSPSSRLLGMQAVIDQQIAELEKA